MCLSCLCACKPYIGASHLSKPSLFALQNRRDTTHAVFWRRRKVFKFCGIRGKDRTVREPHREDNTKKWSPHQSKRVIYLIHTQSYDPVKTSNTHNWIKQNKSRSRENYVPCLCRTSRLMVPVTSLACAVQVDWDGTGYVTCLCCTSRPGWCRLRHLPVPYE